MKKILLFKIGALGDILMATPFIRQLRKAEPKAKIDFLVGKGSEIILKNNKNIDKTIVFDEDIFFKKKMIKLFRLIRNVKKEKYDAIFILDKHRVFNLTAYFFGIKTRIGFDRLGKEGVFLTKKVQYGEVRHETFYYLDLLKAYGKKPDYNDTKIYLDYKKENVKMKDYIVIINAGGNNPGEKSKIRKMPDSLFREIIEQISKKRKAVLVGGKEDKLYYQDFVINKNIINKAGCTLNHSINLMAEAECVITTDSGPMHMAGAVAKKIVCVFGPTNPKRKAPLKKNTISVWKDSNIYEKEYELFGKKPKDKIFMQKIKSKDIMRHI